MTMLTKIGNSQGVRIPKPLIAQAHLENVKIDFEVLDSGLLLKPIKSLKRENWKSNIEEVLLQKENFNKEYKEHSVISSYMLYKSKKSKEIDSSS